MEPRKRTLTTDPTDDERDGALDPNAVEAVTEARIRAQISAGGTLGEALHAQEEEAALDHGSVDRICGRASSQSGADGELIAQAEEAALDHGSVDRIATGRTPARPSAGKRPGGRLPASRKPVHSRVPGAEKPALKEQDNVPVDPEILIHPPSEAPEVRREPVNG
jgi:hypothetical protein